MHIGIGVHRPTADVIRPNTVDLGFDCNIIRNPDNRPRANLVHITRARSVLEDEIGRYSVRLDWEARVYETFFFSAMTNPHFPESIRVSHLSCRRSPPRISCR